jgi:KDO2-lipid IV(A) lauroyltransferase
MTLKDQLKQLKRAIRYYFLKALIDAITCLPVRSMKKLQRLLCKIFPFFFAREIARTRELLPAEFKGQQTQIIKGMLKNQVATLLEVFFYEKLKEQQTNFVTIIGEENLKKAVEEYGTFIILSAHFGNWELIGYELTRLGYPLYVVARPQAVNQMTRLINSYREKRGSKVIMGNNIIESLKLIKKKQVVGIVSDLNAREWGYQVKFFDRTASFYNAPIILSDRGKAPLIPAFAERQPDGRQVIRFEKPVTWGESASMSEKIQAYVKRYEKEFRRRPDQWCWFHERYQHAELGRKE